MGYFVTAMNEDGELLAEFITNVNHKPAHELCSALGHDQEEADTEGWGETYFYTPGEISAAQEAMALASVSFLNEADLWEAEKFLRDIMEWLHQHPNETGVEITFA
jgi:hypothetical protein